MPHSATASRTPISFRTQDFGRWMDAVNDHFVPMDGGVDDRRRFCAGFRVRPTDRGAIAVITGGGSSVSRSRQQAGAADRGYFKILWQLSGRCRLEQFGAGIDLTRGHVAIYDITRPYRLDMDRDSRFVVLSLDTAEFPGWSCPLARDEPHRLAPGSAGQAGLMALMSLLRTDADGDDAELVIDAVSSLMLAAVERSAVRGIEQRDHSRLTRARRIVQARLTDPELGPDLLANALGISRRSLYLLFQHEGTTPAAYIRAQRLQQCRDALAGEHETHRTLTEIAHDYGFFDSAHFSRSFRAAFGASPSAWRRRAHAGMPPPSAPADRSP